MSLACGIVGLPNVGKSTLFNAITESSSAEAANYPFCTIKPNQGIVAVADKRLDHLANMVQSQQTVYNTITVTDIAGLVKGASQGQGLGNRFLGHIREVDSILHLVRCFDETNVHHVEQAVDPLHDVELIDTELIFADLQWIENQLEKKPKGKPPSDPDTKKLKDVLTDLSRMLLDGNPARHYQPTNHDQQRIFSTLPLLTKKPVLYLANVDEGSLKDGNPYTTILTDYAEKQNSEVILVSAKTEAELCSFGPDERKSYLADIGVQETCLARLGAAAFNQLGLIAYYTAGPKEARAWGIPANGSAEEAAALIHSDIARGFIVAETISYEDFSACGSEAQAKADGKMRQEGRSYRVHDGDIFYFRFNV